MREAVEARAKGWSLRAIAAHLGVSPDTVWRDLRASDSGVRNRTPGVRNLTTESDNNVVQLRREAR
jgi:IS30 family transposase